MTNCKKIILSSVIIVLAISAGILIYFLVSKRELLTADNFYKKLNGGTDECNQFGPLNHEKPNEYIRYSRNDGGIEFSIPYNKNWGNNKYSLSPYYEYETPASPLGRRMVFGPLECFVETRAPDGAPWDRATAVSITQLTSEEDLKNSGAGDIKANVEKRNTGNVNVLLVKYHGKDDCDEQVIVLGNKYNYTLSQFGQNCLTAETVYANNLELIRSIKLLP